MTYFIAKVEEYMQCDKKTLAEMLALRDLQAIRPIEPPKTPDIDWQFPSYNIPISSPIMTKDLKIAN